VEPGSKKSVISMKEKLRSYDLTRSGRLRAKQEALHDVRSRTGKAGLQVKIPKSDS
jgi:hypothetical protein